MTQSAGHCESGIHAAIHKKQRDEGVAQHALLSTRREEAVQVRTPGQGAPCAPPVSTTPLARPLRAASPRKGPWGGKAGTAGARAALEIETVLLGGKCPFYWPESHAPWRGGAPHSPALTRQMPTRPLLLAAFQSRAFTRISYS